MTDRDPRPDALPHASTDAPPKHRRPATKPAGKPRNLLLGLSLIIVACCCVCRSLLNQAGGEDLEDVKNVLVLLGLVPVSVSLVGAA